jgi:hypothetical protein
MLLTAKILITIATLGYSAIPAKFDSDETHVLNPSWDPHARFHVVWQVSSYVYFALLALHLLWTAGTDKWPVGMAALFAAFAYGGFWNAVLSMNRYGGSIVSKVNPVPEFTWNFGGRQTKTDANLTLFIGFVVILIIGVICLMVA